MTAFIRKLFGQAPRAPIARRNSLGLEALGDRIVPTVGFSFSANQLTVTSDGASDQIEVRYAAGGLTNVEVVANGSVRCTVPAANISLKLVGNGGNDTLTNNTAIQSTMDGGDGNDTMYGGTGNDTLYGGKGDDQMWGRAGDDAMSGYDGNDALDGGDGNDDLDGSDGNDLMWGGTGNDTMKGSLGDDQMWGQAGDDTMSGYDGNDSIDGGDGYDNVSGGRGSDFLWNWEIGLGQK